MSTLAVVEEILREVNRPVSVREIVEVAGERLPTKSKTPDTVVARDLSMDIKRKGDDSKFVRTSPGRYTMRELIARTVPSNGTSQREMVANEGAPVVSASQTSERAPTRPATAPAISTTDADVASR